MKRSSATRPGQPAPSLTDQAYAQIKEKILALELRPGQFLNESELCAALSIGRMPVHQAVHRLQAEGLLEVIPRKGLVIKPESLNDILALIEARLAMEPNIAALAAQRATKAQIASLQETLKESSRYITQSEDQRKAFMNLDRAFHALVAEAAQNPMLADAQRPLHERSFNIWQLKIWPEDGLVMTQQEHEAILQAIIERDAPSARRAMRSHLESLQKRILAGSLSR